MTEHYLIAEDDENTQVLIVRAFKTLDLSMPVHFVETGDQVIDYLEGRGGFADRQQYPVPALLLLDLKMPKKNGLETLEWIRQSRWRELVTIMFTGSDEESDAREAYRLGVNSFVRKPVGFGELVQILASIHHYWFSCNYFPDDGFCFRKGLSHFKVIRRDGSCGS